MYVHCIPIGIGSLYMHRVSMNAPIGIVLRTCIVSPYNVIIHYELVQICTDGSSQIIEANVSIQLLLLPRPSEVGGKTTKGEDKPCFTYQIFMPYICSLCVSCKFIDVLTLIMHLAPLVAWDSKW